MKFHDINIVLFIYRQLKSSLIGSNKAKNRVIEAGVVPRLLNLLTEPTVTHPDLKVAVAYALGKTAIIKVKQLVYRRNNPDKVEKLLFLGPMKEIAKSMISRILFLCVAI